MAVREADIYWDLLRDRLQLYILCIISLDLIIVIIITLTTDQTAANVTLTTLGEVKRIKHQLVYIKFIRMWNPRMSEVESRGQYSNTVHHTLRMRRGREIQTGLQCHIRITKGLVVKNITARIGLWSIFYLVLAYKMQPGHFLVKFHICMKYITWNHNSFIDWTELWLHFG